jgi:hypothetical protein
LGDLPLQTDHLTFLGGPLILEKHESGVSWPITTTARAAKMIAENFIFEFPGTRVSYKRNHDKNLEKIIVIIGTKIINI